MLDRLILASLNRRAIVMFLAVAFLIWGGLAVTELPLDVLPDLTAPTVAIMTEGRGMAPVEMESLVTLPIESAINGAAGIRRVRSATAVGFSIVWAEFEWDVDIHRARQTVNERLATASLPPNVDRPVLAPISSIMGEILFISLTSDRHSPLELRTAADISIRRRILSIAGVSQVIPIGGGQKQYQVLIDPSRLRDYDVTLTEVENALRQANQNSSAGFRISGGQEYLIQGIGRIQSENDIRNVVVTARESRPVLVRDVAQVQIGAAIKRGEGSHNGKPAVILGIQKQPGVNTLDLTRRLDAALDDIQKTLPQGMVIDKQIFRQSDFIERALANLLNALRDGALLVVVIVFLFLFNIRASIITLVALPLSVVAAALSMKAFGFSINSMTLGGLAIAIGELVDDAIVDVENVVRRLRENAALPEEHRAGSIEVIYQASREIRGSVVFATVIVVLVFLPLFALTGVEGRLLAPLGFAYVTSLVASLAVALTVTPAMCAYLLPHARSVVRGEEPRLVSWLKAVYRPFLNWLLDRPAVPIGFSVVMVAAAIFGFTGVGRAFLPDFNEGTLTVSAVTMPGTSLAQSDELGRALEGLLLRVPEVISTARRTGRAELDEHVQGVESAEIDVNLRAGRPKDAVLADIREKVALLPGMNVMIGQPISHRIDHMLSGTRASIAIKIFGDELGMLRVLAQKVEAAVRGTPGLVDLAVEQQRDVPALRIRVDSADAARYGLQTGQVADVVQTAFLGREVSRVIQGQVSFPLVVRYSEDEKVDLDAIHRTLIDSPSGVRVPLGSIARITQDLGPNFITRESVQRKIVVSGNVAGRDLRGVVEDLERQVREKVKFPEGYRVEYGGQFASEAEASRRLLFLGMMSVVAMVMLLTTAFRSFGDAMVILLNLPLALVGGVAGVYLGGGILSVASMIGFITLFGIASRNGIMLVSHIRHLLDVEGVTDFREAVMRGASERLAPILMTALAAGLALIPIARGMGEPGSELQAPMALVILCGLATSTVLNMVVVPAVYFRTRKPKDDSPRHADLARS